MRNLVVCIVFSFFFWQADAQNRFFTKDAKINFNSSTPLEDIVAESNQATTFIDIDKNEVVFSVLTTSFRFRRALMEEHFNENYMESTKYPKAKFVGKITSPINWKSGQQTIVDVIGQLIMHGVTKEVSLKAKITAGEGIIKTVASLKIIPGDFGIDIPSAVRDKIAKDVTITIDAVYTLYQQ
jgi:polyisoprenoid-binding protein YceI